MGFSHYILSEQSPLLSDQTHLTESMSKLENLLALLIIALLCLWRSEYFAKRFNLELKLTRDVGCNTEVVESRDVASQTRGVTSQTRGVTSQSRGVTSQTRGVDAEPQIEHTNACVLTPILQRVRRKSKIPVLLKPQQTPPPSVTSQIGCATTVVTSQIGCTNTRHVTSPGLYPGTCHFSPRSLKHNNMPKYGSQVTDTPDNAINFTERYSYCNSKIHNEIIIQSPKSRCRTKPRISDNKENACHVTNNKCHVTNNTCHVTNNKCHVTNNTCHVTNKENVAPKRRSLQQPGKKRKQGGSGLFQRRSLNLDSSCRDSSCRDSSCTRENCVTAPRTFYSTSRNLFKICYRNQG